MAFNFCENLKSNSKVAIVGVGFVGSSIAYAMMLEGIASEIALIDINIDKVDGDALDLNHCMQFTRLTQISSGSSFELVSGAQVVIICAGRGQQYGENRSDLLKHNAELFKKIVPEIIKYNNDCIILVVTNPLDALTYLTLKLSGFPSCRVFGSGTVLDTARLRYLLGSYFRISPKDINAFILGEHGDSEFIWLSRASIGGVAIKDFPEYSDTMINDIFEQTKNAVYEIIKKKGATYYAIALVVCKIVRAILQDQSRIFSVSTFIDEELYGVKGVCLSMPTVIRKSGVCQRLRVKLDQSEVFSLTKTASKINDDIELIKYLF